MMAADFVFHKLPLICTISTPNEENSCGRNVIVPFTIWLNMHYMMKTPMNKLYGVNIYKLLSTGISMIGTGGLIYRRYISNNR